MERSNGTLSNSLLIWIVGLIGAILVSLLGVLAAQARDRSADFETDLRNVQAAQAALAASWGERLARLETSVQGQTVAIDDLRKALAAECGQGSRRNAFLPPGDARRPHAVLAAAVRRANGSR